MLNSIFITSFWSSILIVLCLAINRIFKNKLPASFHYYIWLIVIIKLMTPFFINIDYNLVMYMAKPINMPISENEHNNLNTVNFEQDTVFNQNEQLSTNTTKPTIKLNQIFNAQNIWLCVAIFILVYKLIAYFVYKQKLKRSYINLTEDELGNFYEQKQSLKVNANIAVFKSDETQTPFVIGLFNLAIVLPNKKYTETQLNYIFEHELTHIKRKDILIKWLYEIGKALHWFNPYVYIASKNASLYCEISCDAKVLEHKSLNQRKEYGLIIVDIITNIKSINKPLCVSMNSNKSKLKIRMQNILSTQNIKRNVFLNTSLAIIIFALCACSSVKFRENTVYVEEDNMVVEEFENNQKTNILIVGTDNFGNSDTIIVANVDKVKNQISLVSIPRDLLVSEKTVSELKNINKDVPDQIKLQFISQFAQKDAMKYLRQEISDVLNAPIEYYIMLDMSDFEQLIDSMGGVEVNIPEGGLYYSDPMQNLEISLHEGLQLLDGKKAMELMRFRASYRNGDFDRMAVQGQFLKQVYSKLIKDTNFITKLELVFSTLTKNTQTNMRFEHFNLYLRYLSKLDSNSFKTYELPVNVENDRAMFYVIVDTEKLNSDLEGVFK